MQKTLNAIDIEVKFPTRKISYYRITGLAYTRPVGPSYFIYSPNNSIKVGLIAVQSGTRTAAPSDVVMG